jgi:heptosyltransferase III
MSDTPQQILIARTDKLGDVLLALPVAVAIKARYPQVEVGMLVQPYTVPVVELCQAVDTIVRADAPNRIDSARLQEQHWDTAVTLYPNFGLARALKKAGIPRRIGTARRWYSFLFNERVSVPRRAAGRHETDLNFSLLQPLGLDEYDVQFALEIPNELRQRTDGKLAATGIGTEENYIVVHPGSGGSAGNWPPEKFAELAVRAVEQAGCKVLVTGSAEEFTIVQAVTGGNNPAIIPAAGKFNLQEFAAVLQRGNWFVGNSSGPLHLARALNTPVCGLYPHDAVCGPDRWGPYGKRDSVIVPAGQMLRRGTTYGQRCEQLATISVEQVLEHLPG